jgi:hypothetical protein
MELSSYMVGPKMCGDGIPADLTLGVKQISPEIKST